MTTPAKVLEIAKKEVDAKYKEGNNNDTKFGKWYGNNNQPWCAFFVSWVFHQSGSHSLVGIQTPKDITKNDAGEWSLTTHFDKDEKLWYETGKIVTPKLGTIFYPDPCNNEIEGGYLKVWKTHNIDFNAPYELIEAKYNRLIIFDAGQLHAVTPVTKATLRLIYEPLLEHSPLCTRRWLKQFLHQV